MKQLKKSLICGGLMIALALTLGQKPVLGGNSIEFEVTPVYRIPVYVTPIHLLPDFSITFVERVRDDSNPYQTFYRSN